MSCSAAFPAAATPVHLCPAGRHPMDPGWQDCPYCKTEKRRETVVEASSGERRQGSGPGPVSVSPLPPRTDGPRRTERDDDAPRGRQKHRDATLFGDPAAAPAGAAAAHPDEQRRIVALLVTYSWRHGGEVHPVREGRNYIGRDEECEIRIAGDPQLSRRHATILSRGSGCWIDDEKSMSGTFVDGESVEEKRRLENYSEIRAGATTWRFLLVEPETESGEAGAE
jgi:pSer/pThr/pTyr-binding forkhead associated (FHA) protein